MAGPLDVAGQRNGPREWPNPRGAPPQPNRTGFLNSTQKVVSLRCTSTVDNINLIVYDTVILAWPSFHTL